MRDIKNVEDFMKKKAKEDGRAEGRTDIVKAMSSRGLSPEEISQHTGLTLDEIRDMLSYSLIPAVQARLTAGAFNYAYIFSGDVFPHT